MYQFLESTNENLGKIGNLDRPIFVKEIESIMNNLPKNKESSPDGLTGDFYQILRKK